MWSDLISKRNFKKLDFSFHKVLRDSTFVSSFLVTSLIVILLLFNYFNLEILERFLPLKLVVILGLTIPVNNILNSLATQLRCHKKEPYALQAFILGLLITLSTFINAKFFNISSVVVSYVLLVLLISVPWSLIIFKIFRKKYRIK